MARVARSVALFRQVEHEIEEFSKKGRGRTRQYNLLYRELWEFLEVGTPAQRVAACSKKASELMRGLARHLDATTSHGLRKAIFDRAHYRTSAATVRKTWKIGTSELEYAKELAKYSWGSMGAIQEVFDKSLTPWKAEVDEKHELVDVWIEQRAFEEIVLSSVEAYEVPPQRRKAGTEVYGLCFGGEHSKEGHYRGAGQQTLRTIHVARVAPQLRAHAGSDYVEPNRRTSDVHLTVLNEMFPHMQLVGDFHSHPYRTHQDLRTCKGWEWSEADERFNKRWVAEMEERGIAPRIAVIAAIAKRGKWVRPRYLAPNVYQATIGSAHLVIGAYRILTDRRYSKYAVWLNVPGFRNPNRP